MTTRTTGPASTIGKRPLMTLIFPIYAAAQATAPTLTTLHNFTGYPDDGANPNGIVMRADAEIIGTTFAGDGIPPAIFQTHDAPDWVEPSLSHSPAGRCCAGMAYYPAVHSTLLFGGWGNPAIYGDTWAWRDGWIQLFPATSPSARWSPGLASDGVTGGLVLFGGQNNSGEVLNDTWAWDGIIWTQQFPPASPPARRFDQPGIAYDAATRSVVLFGGVDGDNNVFGDTWTWDGVAKTWTQRFPASSPSPRRAPIAYDDATKTVVLFGGDVQNLDIQYNDTWTWDGATWTQQFPASAPAPRTDASMAYDASLGRVVIFGGGYSTPLQNQTWVWDGINWTEVHPAVSPGARYAASMAYDPLNNGLVLFGGFSPQTLDDTWMFTLVPINGANGASER
jgi:hypothetical protein